MEPGVQTVGDAITWLEAVTRLFYDYGPFLLAIFCVIYLWRWSYNRFREACNREPPNPVEVRQAQLFTWASMVLTVALMAVSVTYWFGQNYREYHVYEGVILDVEAYATLESPNRPFYLAKAKEKKAPDGTVLFCDYKFAVISSEPLGQEEIIVSYNTGGGRHHYLAVPYHHRGKPTLTVQYQDGKWSIRDLKPEGGESVSLGPSRAWAADTRVLKTFPKGIVVDIIQLQQAAVPTMPGHQCWTQLYRADFAAGSRADCLRGLLEMKPTQLKALAGREFGGEPLWLTVYDLTKHSDPEVNSLARQVAYKRLDLVGYLSELWGRGGAGCTQMRALLPRLDQGLAEQVMARLRSQPQGARCLAEMGLRPGAAGLGADSLVPMATRQGDRYYMVVKWGGDEAVRACLARFFSTRTGRGLAEEVAILRRSNQRMVSATEKRDALATAAALRACRAEVHFTSLLAGR